MFGDQYIGVNIEHPWSFAEIARCMKAEGITCDHRDQVGDALKQAVQNQSEGKTTVIEVMLTRELDESHLRNTKLPTRYLKKYLSTIKQSSCTSEQPIGI